MSDNTNEKINSSFWDIIKTSIGKIRDEILIYSLTTIFMITFISIYLRTIDITVIGIILTIHIVGLIAFFYKKESTEKDNDFEKFIEFTINFPHNLPNPFNYLISTNKTVNFKIKFIIDNKSEKQFDTSIYIKSNSQAIGFFLDEEKKVWKRHYLIFPYRESITLSRDNFIEQSVGPLHETTFTFSAIYRPMWALDDYSRKKQVVLLYQVKAESGKIVYDSNTRRLEIPFAEKEPEDKVIPS